MISLVAFLSWKDYPGFIWFINSSASYWSCESSFSPPPPNFFSRNGNNWGIIHIYLVSNNVDNVPRWNLKLSRLLFLMNIWNLQFNKQDVWQGTQLLALDVTVAMGLVKRALTGDELTEKEKKTLKRTLTDMASVVPIGVLMLLPVSWTFFIVLMFYICHISCSC